jgi:hypothetical protein
MHVMTSTSNKCHGHKIDAGAAAQAPVKVTPIRENTPEKAKLIDLFETKKWGKLPPANSNDDLEAILKKNNWNRSQLINHLREFGIVLGPTAPKSLKGQKKKSFNHSRQTVTQRLRYSRRLGRRATLLLSSL